MAAAEDFETLLVLFSASPEAERPELLDRFLATWEERRSRWGFPRSERLHLVRRYIRSPQDFHTLLTLFSAFPEDERPQLSIGFSECGRSGVRNAASPIRVGSISCAVTSVANR